MTDELAGRIVDAYKASPLLTGLLILNICTIVGFGWWEYRRVGAVDAFVQKQLAKHEALQERLIQMAKECVK